MSLLFTSLVLIFTVFIIIKRINTPKKKSYRTKRIEEIEIPNNMFERFEWYNRNINKIPWELANSISLKVFDKEHFLAVGEYISGNIHLSKETSFTSSLYVINDTLYILKYINEYGTKILSFQENKLIKMGEIPTSFITSINVEDGSSIEKRVTLGRVLLVGVFALAWKKNKKNSLALLVIGWNDGKFDQETIFQYTGDDAISKANNAKIKIQQLCR